MMRKTWKTWLELKIGTFGQIRLDQKIGTFGKVGGQTGNDAPNLETLFRFEKKVLLGKLDLIRLENRYFWKSQWLDWK